MRTLVLALFFCLTCAGLAWPQEPLKLRADLVLLEPLAFDESGLQVPGLSKQEFEVYDNGVKQRIDRFSIETLATSYGVLLNTSSATAGQRIETAKDFASELIALNDPKDETFVVRFCEGLTILQDLTSDKKALINTLGRLQPFGGAQPLDPLYFGLSRIRIGKFFRTSPNDPTREVLNNKTALVMVTSGPILDFECDPQGKHARELVRQESDVPIYVVEVVAPQEKSLHRGPRIGNCGQVECTGGGKATVADERYTRDFFSSITKITGGKMFQVGAHDAKAMAKTVSEQIRSGYALGYYPSDSSPRWHEVKVVARRDGQELHVRCRQGYYQPGS